MVNHAVRRSRVSTRRRFSAFSPNVSLVIPGAKSIEQLEANVTAVRRGPLSNEAIEEIARLRNEFLPKIVS